MKKYALIFLVSLLMASTYVQAAQPDQSHNLSEIEPVDTDFNMSNFAIHNLSSLKLNDGTLDGTGFVINDFSISDENRNYVFSLDPNAGQYEIAGADLDLSGNSIIQPSQIETGGSNIGVVDSSTGLDLVRFKEGGEVEVVGQLDMSGSNMSNFFGASCPSGETVVDVNQDGTYQCMDVADEVQNEYVNRDGDSMLGALDMAGNALTDTSGTLTFGGGDAEVSNGAMDVVGSYGYLGSSAELEYDSSTGSVRLRREDGASGLTLQSNGNLVVENGQLLATNAGAQIDGGSLNLNSNDIQNINQLAGFFDNPCSSGKAVVDVDDSGNFQCMNVSDEVSSDYVARAGDTMTGTLDMGLDGNDDIIGIGNLGGTDIVNSNNINAGAVGSSEIASNSVAVTELDEGDVDARYVNLAGDSLSGSLTMNGNDIISPGLVDGVDVGSPGNALVIDGSNHYAVDSNSIAVSELDEGDVDARYVQIAGDRMEGSLDMNGNQIQNFFSSACSSGKAVVDVDDSGNFQCMNVTDEVQNEYVNRDGDTMTGSLDMQGNNIDGVGTINSGGTTVRTGGNIEVGSGTVTSGSQMCIGDQC